MQDKKYSILDGEMPQSAPRRESDPGSDPRLLLLDDRDNVVVVTARIRAGETISLEGRPVPMAADMPLGHKL
ncbi:MAG: hypothetical protein K8F58_03380, partial [Bauldia sp.]|nr:hypothetical protein [Bauldia sp.]